MKNDLSCYQCDTMEDGEKCSNLAMGNKTAMLKKCQGDKRLCMVGIFSRRSPNINPMGYENDGVVSGEAVFVHDLDREFHLCAPTMVPPARLHRPLRT